ncbi:MAG: hypothetical protein U0353_35670 [Sandaracinus sp.]
MRASWVIGLGLSFVIVLGCLGSGVYLLLSAPRAHTPAAFVGSASLRAQLGCPTGPLASADAPILDARRAALGLEGEVRVIDPQTIELALRAVQGPDVIRALATPQRLALTEVLDGAVTLAPDALPPGVTQRPVGTGGELGFFASSPSALVPLGAHTPTDARFVVGCASRMGEAPECEGVFVRSAGGLDNTDVESASVFANELDGRPQISIEFTPSGASDFTMLTRRLVRRRLAIVLDDHLMSAPVVMEEIDGGRATITLGEATSAEALEAEAQALAIALDVGAPLGCAWELQRLE